MSRHAFPLLPAYLQPVGATIDAPEIRGILESADLAGFSDATAGDVSECGYHAARIDFRHGETLAGLAAEWFPEGIAGARQLEPFGPFGNGGGGIILRDRDGFRYCGAWADSDRLGRAWRRLSGEWNESDTERAIHSAGERGAKIPHGRGFRIERADGFRGVSIAFRLVSDTGADILIQGDRERAAVAGNFGYILRGPFACECFRRTDGSEACGYCGKTAEDFAGEALAMIRDLAGSKVRAEDPGYFNRED